MNDPYANQGGGDLMPPPNSIENLAKQSGLIDAVNQSNFENQHVPMEVQNEFDDDMSSEESLPQDLGEYSDFVEFEEKPKRKKKRHNNAQERIFDLSNKVATKQQQNEELLLKAEMQERELKRISDENRFLLLNHERKLLEDEENALSYEWDEAHRDGDAQRLRALNKDLKTIDDKRRVYDDHLNEISIRYERYREEEEQEQQFQQEFNQAKRAALDEFSDTRELSSPLYGGFLKHHDFLDPYSENFDVNLVERVRPIKTDLLQEYKLTGRSKEIGSTDYFAEQSRRIHQNLNPKFRKNTMMVNDPRYQEPNYMKIQNDLNNQYNHGYQQPQQHYNYPPQNGYMQQPVQQPQMGGYPNQQQQNRQPMNHSVAPVNRTGYNQQYISSPNDIALDEAQQEAAGLFGRALNNLSQKVYGRSMDKAEVTNQYKRGIYNMNNSGE